MIIPDHWLVRGAQSAIFFYISCAPCLGVSYTRRRKKEAARDRKLKEAELARRPHIYPHPGPAEMNEHWREEVDVEPSTSRKRPRKGTKDSAGKPTDKQASLASFESTKDVARLGSGETLPRGSTKKRYGRPDEESAWTIEEENAARKRRKAGHDYRIVTAPPVNDMHPAIVSMIPLNPDDRRWMKELPPSTDFLDGKVKVTILGRTESKRATVQADQDNSIINTIPAVQDSMYPATATSGNMNRGQKAGYERFSTPISRPDSAVSTGRRTRYRPVSSRLQADSSTASSDADDDEGFLHIRPHQVYRADRAPSRQRSRRHQLAGVADQDFATNSGRASSQTPPSFSPALRPQSMNSENLSPKTSPLSLASLESPFSSEDERLPSPRVRSMRNKFHNPTGISLLPSKALSTRSQRQPEQVEKETSLRPFHLLRTSKSHTDSDSFPAPGAEKITEILAGLQLRGAENSFSPGPQGSVELDANIGDVMEWKQLSEMAAKEHMWLGPAPVRSETALSREKRHSTDF